MIPGDDPRWDIALIYQGLSMLCNGLKDMHGSFSVCEYYREGRGLQNGEIAGPKYFAPDPLKAG